MNFDPTQLPTNSIPSREEEVIAEREAAAAGSSSMFTIFGLIVAVAIIAIVIAVSPWSGGGNGATNIAPGQGGGDNGPAPSQQLNPAQPQIVPTTVISPR